jgi:N-acetylmuramoyl-L-alanine amidase
MTFLKSLHSILLATVLFTTFAFTHPLIAQDARFTVVLDAGHGGHDPGAKGAISREKDINLAVTLKLGELIDRKFKDVKLVYSRKTDKYLTLQERADVVNDNHADMFICVHTNSAQSPAASGAESFTLGVGKTKGNLEVAMRENSVITLEDNYKTKYQGFDPSSVDSYIMFEFMQDKYIDRSVNFASNIQKQFRNYCNRVDRGVRQAGFWVLYRSACPSVLVELGFISNPAEERYLNSEQGQTELASAIFNAFVDYKKDHDKKSGRQVSAVAKIEQPIKLKEAPLTIQALPVTNKSEISDSNQIHSKVISTTQAQDSIKVLSKSNSTPVRDNAKNVIEIALAKKSTLETKKNNLSEVPVFKLQLLASAKKLALNSTTFKGIKDIDSFVEEGFYKYTVGAETDYSKIEKIKTKLHSKFPEAFIIAFVGDKKITAKAALKLRK